MSLFHFNFCGNSILIATFSLSRHTYVSRCRSGLQKVPRRCDVSSRRGRVAVRSASVHHSLPFCLISSILISCLASDVYLLPHRSNVGLLSLYTLHDPAASSNSCFSIRSRTCMILTWVALFCLSSPSLPSFGLSLLLLSVCAKLSVQILVFSPPHNVRSLS